MNQSSRDGDAWPLYLPDLPPIDYSNQSSSLRLYTAEQMFAYGRTCIEHARPEGFVLVPREGIEAQIKHMVNRFLGWRLPTDFSPDAGISYKRPNYAHAPIESDHPVGTNLFDAQQATEMVRYMLQELPAAPKGD